MEGTYFTLSIEESGLASLLFDDPKEKVNTFSLPVLQELEKQIDALKDNPQIKLLRFYSNKEGVFVAGADLKTFALAFEEPKKIQEIIETGHRVFRKIETLPFPTLAEINGACLGGGLEFALCCTFRIGSDSDKVKLGLPEVSLGIFPGWGGTQRLPRLIGLEAGVSLIASGRTLPALKAYKMGLLDQVFADVFFQEKAKAFALTLLDSEKRTKDLKKRSLLSWRRFFMEKTYIIPTWLFHQAKKTILEKTKGHYPAPILAVELIERTFFLSLEQGLEEEKKTFLDHLNKGFIHAKSLTSLFFASEAIKKDPGFHLPKVLPPPIKKVGLIGAGTMGGKIAWLFCQADLPIRMKDLQWNLVGKGLSCVFSLFQKQVKEKKLKKTEANLKFHKVSGCLDYSGFQSADLVIEAVVENLSVKKALFQELETFLSNEAIIASNTSSLQISEMSEGMRHPQRVVGLHFFNPPNKMPLVEVVRSKHTSDETVAAAIQICKTLKKTPIVVADCPGFLVNRIFMKAANEIVELLQQGVPLKDLEALMLHFGMPMSPFLLLDEVGNDVTYKVAKSLETAYGQRMKAPKLLAMLVENNFLGKKVKKGFYLYQGKKPTLNPEISPLLKGLKSPPLQPFEKPQERIFFSMINEAALCLQEEVVASATLLDMALILGIGFPPFKGGLLRFADATGVPYIIQELKKYEAVYGEKFSVCEKLQNTNCFYP